MMTEHTAAVQKAMKMIEAQHWANTPTGIHSHALKSMWYDTPETIAEDFVDGKGVTDMSYADGRIIRTRGGEYIRTFGKAREGDELLEAYLNKV